MDPTSHPDIMTLLAQMAQQQQSFQQQMLQQQQIAQLGLGPYHSGVRLAPIYPGFAQAQPGPGPAPAQLGPPPAGPLPAQLGPPHAGPLPAQLGPPPAQRGPVKSSEPLLTGRNTLLSPKEVLRILRNPSSFTDRVSDFAFAKGGEAEAEVV